MIIKPNNPYDPNSEWLTAIIGCQYRADKQDGHWLDDAIYWWSKRFTKEVKEPHSHSEILYLKDLPLVFSADTRRGDGFVGTRFEEARIVLRNPDRWDLYLKWVKQKEVYAMFERALKIENKRYAYVNIVLHYFLPLGWLGGFIGMMAVIWYCSQTVYYTICGKKIRISPIRLTRWYNKNGWRKLTDEQKKAMCKNWAGDDD